VASDPLSGSNRSAVVDREFPVVYPDIEMPRGTLVKVLPLGGALWIDKLCVFVGWHSLKYHGHPWCWVVDRDGQKTLLPRQALDIISYPNDHKGD